LSSPNTDAAAAFYRELLNWSATEPGPVEETGGYPLFKQEGKNVGGLMGHLQEGQPTMWSTCISVADADETAETARPRAAASWSSRWT
jgi:predicted enzyme related to lactoylglutathione lyase